MYSQEQIKQIKQLIGNYLESSNLLDKVKQKIKEENLDPKDLNDKKLLEILKETNIYDKISLEMKQVISQNKEKTADQLPQIKATTSRRALHLKLGQGKAFLQYVNGGSDKKLQFYVNFLKQRYSTGLVPASVEPIFNEVYPKFSILIHLELHL